MVGMAGETDWLALCRRVVARQEELFAAQRGSRARTVYEGRGEGGDMTLALDRRCEDIVFDELERVGGGEALLAISEERGEVQIGAGEASTRVVIDPIDGSLNVRRTLPSHSLSIAVASGPSMADVEFGFVHDFGSGEEFAARRGAGATLNGIPVLADWPDNGLEVVGLESAEPAWIGPAIAALEGKAYRLRAIGSIAISLSYVAVGRFDGMLSGRPCRSVDAAAAQLIVGEAGCVMAFTGVAPEDASLDLDARYAVCAARDEERLALVAEAQAQGPAVRG
jgi:myo-inositol-1(or 4)-monophosphatase